MRPTILVAIPALVMRLPSMMQCWADKLAGKWEDGECDFTNMFPCMAEMGGNPFMAFMGGMGCAEQMACSEQDDEEPEKEQDNKEAVHRGITCDGCGISPIAGIRFKCTVCPNYDLCVACEAKGEHAPAHPLLQMRAPVETESLHRGVLCNACGVTPIKGARFKCSVCPDYDLCEDCERKAEHPHPLLKLRIPEEKPEGGWRRRHQGFHRGAHHGPHHGHHGAHQGPGAHHGHPGHHGPGHQGPGPHCRRPFGPGGFRGFGPFGSAGGPSGFRAPGIDTPASGFGPGFGGFGGPAAWGPMFHRMFGGRGAGRCARNPNGPSSTFISDVSLPDGTEVAVGTDVMKTWKLRNDGPQAWPEGTTLNLKRCKGAFESWPQPLAKLADSGEEVEVSALIRPLEAGRGMVCFRLADASGQPFGAKVWADVLAKAPEAKKEESAPVPEPKAEAVSPHELALNALASMGFANREFNLVLLQTEKGNLERVIMRLLEAK